MKTAVITGGNSGVGKATAIHLAKKGYRVIIHGRDTEKTRLAVQEIKQQSRNDNVEGIAADISLLKGMKLLADEIKNRTNTIHALVLSTGVILPDHIITSDGIEAGFAVQYLSRFALTQLLLPELKTGQAKIVLVSSRTMKDAQIYFDDLAMKKSFTMMKALGQEMLANHLFVQEFAKRNPGMVMNVLHPGITKTGIMRETGFFLRLLVNAFGQSADKASRNVIYLADDPGANFSGYFLSKPGKPQAKEKIERDAATAERLWNTSMELIRPIL